MNIYLYAYLGFLFSLFVPLFVEMVRVRKTLKILLRKTEKLVED